MRACAVLALGLVAGTLAAGMAWGQVATRTVVLADDPAPGGGFFNGTTLYSSDVFQAPVINAVGDVAFAAYLNNGSSFVHTSHGIWATQGGVLRQVIRQGNPIAGSGGLVFNSDWTSKRYPTLALSDSGFVAHAGIAGEPDTLSGYHGIVWLETDTGPKTLAIRGMPAPGLPGQAFGYLESRISDENAAIAISCAGTAVFQTVLEDEADSTWGEALWKHSNGSTEAIVSSASDPPQGFDTPWDFAGNYIFWRPPAINRNNDVAFRAGLRDAEDLPCCSGVWQSLEGDVQPVAMVGDPVPASIEGTVFDWFSEKVMLNNRDEVAFLAHTSTTDDFGAWGIWLARDGAIEQIAHEGDTILCGGGEFHIVQLQHRVLLNDQGDIAFQASVSAFADGANTTDVVCRHGRDGSLFIAQSGEVAPGANGARFERFLPAIQMNARGDIAFTARLDDDRTGLWVYDSARDWLKFVAIEGEPFDRGDSAVPRLSLVSSRWTTDYNDVIGGYVFSPRVMGGCRGLNDQGQLVYQLPFEGETQRAGLFISTLPDPCFADIAGVADCFSGESDGAIDLSDFSCYLARWAEADARADITVTNECLPGLGGDGVDLSDFSCYLAEWARGCP
ncbi:MAG: choice-of-anchor tandem repeat NxxGxxAF-containing protein [Planctomycetota bacterium]